MNRSGVVLVEPGLQLLASSTLTGTTFPYLAIFRSLSLIGALKRAV